MKFKILSREGIKQYETNKKHIVISIADPEAEPVEILSDNPPLGILYLKFPDFDRPYMKGYQYNHLLFDKYNAKDILKFVNQHKDSIELIVCQCEAGISRSAGVAGALSKILNGEDFYIFNHYLPNRLVYNTILKEAKKYGLL